MGDGCKHVPPKNLPGYEVESFTSGPNSTSTSCAVGRICDHSHVFEIRNYHLYDVNISVGVSSTTDGVEICNLNEDPEKRVQWTMTGKVPAAPYRPEKHALPMARAVLARKFALPAVVTKSGTFYL